MKRESTHQKFDLLFELIRTDFKLRYNDSALGIIWVLLKPLLSFTILYVVFSALSGGQANFKIYLLLGIMLWGYFSEGILFGMGSLLGKAHIILKVKFPKDIAILSSVSMAVVNMFFNLIILAVFVFFSDVGMTWQSAGYFAFLLALIAALSYGISLFTSVLSVRLRDLKNIMDILLQFGFYTVPIIYNINIVPYPYRTLIEYNPLTLVIQSARRAIADGEIVHWKANLVLTGITFIIIVVGTWFFNKQVRKIAEYY